MTDTDGHDHCLHNDGDWCCICASAECEECQQYGQCLDHDYEWLHDEGRATE